MSFEVFLYIAVALFLVGVYFVHFFITPKHSLLRYWFGPFREWLKDRLNGQGSDGTLWSEVWFRLVTSFRRTKHPKVYYWSFSGKTAVCLSQDYDRAAKKSWKAVWKSGENPFRLRIKVSEVVVFENDEYDQLYLKCLTALCEIERKDFIVEGKQLECESDFQDAYRYFHGYSWPRPGVVVFHSSVGKNGLILRVVPPELENRSPLNDSHFNIWTWMSQGN